MVAQQVLRDAVRIAAAQAVCLAVAMWSPAAVSADDGQRGATSGGAGTAPRVDHKRAVLIIDLGEGDSAMRRARRERLASDLTAKEIAVPTAGDLAAAATGEMGEAHADRGREALAAASVAFSAPDCPTAQTQTSQAILAFAAAQADGGDVQDELIRAHVLALLCAHQEGQVQTVSRTARALRALGAPEPPVGVPSHIWSNYPALDALGGQRRFELQVETTPNGGAIWVNHAYVGQAPQTLWLAEGPHILAASSAGGSSPGGIGAAVAERVVIERYREQRTLHLPAVQPATRGVGEQVAKWRSSATQPTVRAIGEVLALAGVDHAVVIGRGGQLDVYRRQGRTNAELLGRASAAVEVERLLDAPPRLALAAASTASAVPRPDLTSGGTGEAASPPTKWWVYAAIAGAVAIGAGVILVNELGSDYQRIEISLP